VNVLVATAMYPTPQNPAFGSFVRTQVEALKGAGLDVDVMVLQGRPRKLIYPRGIVQLRQRLARQPVSLVHAHYGYVGMVARTQWRVPVVVTYHGDDLLGTIGASGRTRLLSRGTAAASRLLARLVDAVIVQSEQMASKIPHPNVHVIPHEVDLETFRPTERERARALLGLDPGKSYLLFAANPRIAVKRFPLAQAVAERLAGQDPAVELLVVYRETQDRLALYMSACDALVFPSYQEGSPNIVKQAMACNLPIVSTDVGDVRQIVGATAGCHVCRPDVAEFAERLGQVLRSRERTQGRQRVGHLDCRNTAERIIAVYEETLRRCRPAAGRSERAVLSGRRSGMCGICGVYEYGQRRAVDRAVLGDMLAAIRHRGPDDEGIHLDRDLGIGARRLSIIDLAGGRQPIASEDGRVVVVCNGEIYNYRELTDRLRRGGHRFSSAVDTEVIVHLYEDHGQDCVQHLRGMFGFALWDAGQRRLFLARDRLGIKPLYYTLAGQRLIFGSEIKAILRHPEVVVRPDLEALSNFLSLKYVPAPQTMFEGIFALPPGCTLTCDEDGATVRPYWDLSFARHDSRPVSEAACAEQLESLLQQSVREHLMSDVPFGAFLSGGVDSSTIVALMSQFLDEPVKTFSVGFTGEGAAFSELPYARLVSERYQTDHHEVLIGARDLIDLAEKVVWHLDQPIADEAALANYMVAELASRHVKMVLTGEGGDELFAGYARYVGERLASVARHVPAPARSLALAASARLPGLRRPKIALFALCQADEITRLTSWFPLFNHAAKAALLSGELRRQLDGASSDAVFARQLAGSDATDPLSRMLYVDTKLWLPDDLLARGDKMSMAASLEARVPLLDHRLVEFAASLPPHLKVRRLARKYLLKKVAGRWLPREILERKKQGFPMPMSVWFRGEARQFVRDLLSPTTLRRRGLFDPGYVERLLGEHEAGSADHGGLVWGLLGVELWHRLFVDARPGGVPGPTPPVGAGRGGTA
jgi:asparagine synthase (glutamine-hydrolysing)